ncbi:MAG TPA: hypothetical protein VK195_14250 [Burkholderiaceae bacterium]|nr:hypothetical protein [Burkholderiaceae bacterium]
MLCSWPASAHCAGLEVVDQGQAVLATHDCITFRNRNRHEPQRVRALVDHLVEGFTALPAPRAPRARRRSAVA